MSEIDFPAVWRAHLERRAVAVSCLANARFEIALLRPMPRAERPSSLARQHERARRYRRRLRALERHERRVLIPALVRDMVGKAVNRLMESLFLTGTGEAMEGVTAASISAAQAFEDFRIAMERSAPDVSRETGGLEPAAVTIDEIVADPLPPDLPARLAAACGVPAKFIGATVSEAPVRTEHGAEFIIPAGSPLLLRHRINAPRTCRQCGWTLPARFTAYRGACPSCGWHPEAGRDCFLDGDALEVIRDRFDLEGGWRE